MEITLLKTLLSSIFRFGLLSSCNGMRQWLVQKSYQEIDEILNLLRPILDAIVDSKMVLDEQLKHALGELDAIINEAAELVEGWHQMTSKVYFTLQMESLVSRAKTSGLEICKLLVMLLQFPTEALSSALVQSSCQNCIQKIQHATSARTSDLIKEAIKNLEEDTTPSSEILVKIAESLSLVTNQELLQESVALEKLKVKVDCEKPTGEMEHIDHLLALVTHMRDSLMKLKQSEAINGMPIPADFRCPLSLEMMSDPVIVASGQTYERAFITKWLDQGLMVCPKSCQTLSHTNLIPNYTVKALIANWCKSNNIKLPSPLKLENLNEPLGLHAHADSNFRDSRTLPHADDSFRRNGPTLPECIRPNGAHQNNRLASPLHPNADMEAVVVNGLPSGTTLDAGNGLEADITRVSLSSSEERAAVLGEEWKVCPGGEASISSRTDFSKVSLVDKRLSVHNRSSRVSSAVSNMDANNPSHLSSEVTCYSSNASGELMPETSPPVIPHREPELSPLLAEARCRSQIWGRPPGRLVSRMVSSPALDTKVDLSGVETQVWKLIEDLQSSSVDVQTTAAAELRLLSKHSMDNRIVIANCGAISYLVGLLHSPDSKTQENAVTALLNLSINDNNKIAIANAGAIDPLIHVLETGNPEAKENSAATLFSLSVIDENKVKIGRSGAIKPLVELLGNGTPRGKKDAATALFNLSIFHENKTLIVQAGAVKYLVKLMDPAAGMVDKAVAVLANLSTIHEGRVAIGNEGGIPVLVGVVELGSARGKENAAAALLQLCTDSKKFCNLVLQEGAVPPLVALSQSGTPRAKEKAQALLSFFRSQRHGNNGRS